MVRVKGRRKAVPPPGVAADNDSIDLGRELQASDLMDESSSHDVTVIAAPASTSSAGIGSMPPSTAAVVLQQVASVRAQNPVAFDAVVEARRVGVTGGGDAEVSLAPSTGVGATAVVTAPTVSSSAPVANASLNGTTNSGSSDQPSNSTLNTTDTSGTSGVDMDTSQDGDQEKPALDFNECVSFLEDHVRQHFPVTARPTTLVDISMVATRLDKSQEAMGLDDKGDMAIMAAEKMVKGVKSYINSMKSVMDHMTVSMIVNWT